MNLPTISSVSIIGAVCSIILSIGVPILLMIIGKKKFAAKLSSFFIGAATFLLFAMVFEQMLHALVIKVLGLNAGSNEWLYYFYGAMAAAVFEETGRIVAMKYVMKKNFNFQNAFMYGVGHGGIEAIILGGLAGISNLITMLMINSGALGTSLAALSSEVQQQTYAQLSALWNTSPALFFVAGIERISAIILHIGLSLIIFRGLKDRKGKTLAIAYGIHFLVDFAAIALASRINVWFVEAIILAMAVVTFMLAHRLNKKADGTESNKDTINENN